MRRVNIRDVAKAAGVSVATVSKALNGYPDVNPETRTRIQEVANQLNYVADTNARNMGGKVETTTIALLVIAGVSALLVRVLLIPIVILPAIAAWLFTLLLEPVFQRYQPPADPDSKAESQEEEV